MAEKNIPESVEYNRVHWEDNETSVDAENLNIMDKGIVEIVNAYNALPAWVKALNKPQYTSTEVGAESVGTSERVVAEHNVDVLAHTTTLALKNHTHNIDKLIGYEDIEAKNAKALGNKTPDYYLDYNNFVNIPKEKTKLSEFENDCNYIKSDDFRVLIKGVYAGGFVSTRQQFNLGFTPKELHIYEKDEYTGEVSTTWTLTSTYDAPELGLLVEFGEDYFAITSTKGLMNNPHKIYLWFAYSTVVGSMTTEINAESTDSQYPSAKAVYDYVERRINEILNNNL